MAVTYSCLRSSPFGPVVIHWTVHGDRPKISRILLPNPGDSTRQFAEAMLADSLPYRCDGIDEIADRVEAFLNGVDITFSLDVIRLDLCPEFQRKVLRAEHGIRRGSVSTYRRIAKHIGRPTAARAVGSALAKNPFPIIIPCHRAIGSDRSLGGFQGGPQMKRALLEMEGISFDKAGRVVTDEFFY
jgi:methylated-DNA-[protein]-cysteine S-methyltransferase